ncbi:MAG: hypothetical protein HY288_17560 [Planctomycetia bacterium]|nr:hypothetical protein [Planctomycetia bacterium]
MTAGVRLIETANRVLARRQFLPRVAVSLRHHEGFQHRPSDFQQPSHQAALHQVDALAVGRGPFHKLLDFPQLPLRLEKRTLLGQDHGWASCRGVNDSLSPLRSTRGGPLSHLRASKRCNPLHFNVLSPEERELRPNGIRLQDGRASKSIDVNFVSTA